MQVDLIDTYDAFTALKHDWDKVYQKDPDAQFFMSWTWFSRVFLEYPDEWRILAVNPGEPGDSYVCFFPICLKTIWSKRKHRFRNEIHMAGTLLWGQYTGFICDPDWDESAIPSLTAHLKKLHWSRISLKYLYVSESRLSLFSNAFTDTLFSVSYRERMINNGATNNLICPYIELPKDYETYLQSSLSSNTRQKIRRHMRHFENSEDLRIASANEDTIQEYLDILVEFWIQRWMESKGSKTKNLARKYRIILQHMFECGSLYMPVLWRGNTPLMVLANFIDREKRSVFFFVSGRNEQMAEPYIGLILQANSIRWAIENEFTTYDFCHGNELYKYSYGAKDRLLKHLIIKTKSGDNLNDILDPSCIDRVMAQTIKFIEESQFKEAKIACQQVREACRITRQFNHTPGGYSENTGKSSEQDHAARESQKIRAWAGKGDGESSEPAGIKTPFNSRTTRGIGPPQR